MIIDFLHGLCMAIADSVPGVSGGTIAFILGFYEKFINAFHDVADKEKRKEALPYLCKLGLGWVVGMISSILILSKLFEKNVYTLCSAFLGLTVVAIPLVIKGELETVKVKYENIIFTLLGFGLVSAISLGSESSAFTITSVESLSFAQYVYLFVTGALAISAMVLPGISGSTLLLIFGVYLPIVYGVKEFLHLNFAVFPGLFVFGMGVIIGAVTAVSLIRKALKTRRSQAVYFVIGLMLGSLIAIVMGPTTLNVPKPALSLTTFKPVAFIIGAGILVTLEMIKRLKENK